MNHNWIRLRSAGVRHFRGRDLILIMLLDEGEIQPFYRSTGSSSNMPGRWLPFDGIRFDHWFEKSRFAHDNYGVGDPLHRFGTEQLRIISDMLADETIPKPGAEDHEPKTVNRWIDFWRNAQVSATASALAST